MFYKNAYIVLFVYDITNKKSFIDLKNIWYDELIKTGEKKAVME
jgi:GTPase SAR1 family protein